MNLAKLNGITATIIASANCGLDAQRIAGKLVAKYGMRESQALALVVAVLAIT